MVDIGDVCVGTCLKSGIGKVVTIIPYSHGIVTEHATGIYPVAAIFALGRETDLDRSLTEVREEEEKSAGADLCIHVGKTCGIPDGAIRTERGAMTIMEVQIEERGTYLLEAEVRSELDNDLAQIPMGISIGSHAIETVSLSGAQKEWKKISVPLPSVMSFTFYLKLFFALGGMGIRRVRLSLLESQEGDVAEHLSGRQTD